MKIETRCLHAGFDYDGEVMANAVPIHRSSAFNFRDAKHAEDLFHLREFGNIYSRLTNPTQEILEKRVAALEGGVGALAFASGLSAIFSAVGNLCQAGDEIVSSSKLYGGSFTQFNDIFPQFGVYVHFVDPVDPENFVAAITPKTKALYCETVSNPGLEVTDLEAIATIAHNHGIPLIVDSTFATPYLNQPIEHGADIVIHSLTKWMGGHGIGIGGIVIDSGRFDWASEKFPLFHEPDKTFQNQRWGYDLPEELLPMAYILRLRARMLRDIGACISPDNAWMFLQGIETLPLRMERHCQNALAVANYLQEHEGVSWVRYPGLEDDPAYALNQKYLQGKGGSMVTFGISGGREAGRAFIENLTLFDHVANVGDAKSLAIHPATTTHSQLTEEEQRETGIAPELVRLSIGIEHIDDIVKDLDCALVQAGRAVKQQTVS